MNGEWHLWLLLIWSFLSSSKACGHDSWGWRWSLQLTRFRQWNIFPSLLQGRPFRSPIISSYYLSIYNYLEPIRRLFAGTCVELWGFLAGKPQSIHWVSKYPFIFWIMAPFSSLGSSFSAKWSSASSLLIRSSSHQFCVPGGVSS